MVILILYQIFFRIVVFGAWLSVVFNIVGKIWNEEILFASLRNAIVLYVVSIFMAVILSYLCFRILYAVI